MLQKFSATVPDVSIVTPMYNSSITIRETIDSVRAQSFKNWEMLVIDDHSTDNSAELAQKATTEDSRISFLSLTGGERGPACARNRAIEVSCGRFIAFVDSDDKWHPEKLTRQLEFMAATNSAFSYTNYYKIDTTSQVVGEVGNLPETVAYNDLLRSCPIGCLTAMYDTQQLGKVFMPDIPRGQDYGLWLRILRRHPTADLLPEFLAYYRIGGNSLSSRKFLKAGSIWKLYRTEEEMGAAKAAFHLLRHSLSSLRR